jgi:hypothetical protein
MMFVCPSVSSFVLMEQLGFRYLSFSSKICWENWLKSQEKQVLYTNNFSHLWYLDEFFLEWEVF